LLRPNWDDHEDTAPEPDRRWFERDLPRRWTHDADLDPPVSPDSPYRKHWPPLHESSPVDRHKVSRREAARADADADDRPRWSDDPQSPRRRINAASQHHSHWTNEFPQHPRVPRLLDRTSPNRRWAPVSQRRLTAIPNMLVRPDVEGSFPRTRRWRADPSHERDAPQVPVNYILHPQSFSHQRATEYPPVTQHHADFPLRHQPAPKMDYEKVYQHPAPKMDYEKVLQHTAPKMDYEKVFQHPAPKMDYEKVLQHTAPKMDYEKVFQHPVDYGSALPQPQVDLASMLPLPQQPAHYPSVLPQPPMDYSALLPQQPMDYTTLLPQPTLDYRAALPQQPLDYRAALPHAVDYAPQVYGWMDYANMMAQRSVNFGVPSADYGAAPVLQGTDRKGATSAPPNLMWSSQIPHFHANAS